MTTATTSEVVRNPPDADSVVLEAPPPRNGLLDLDVEKLGRQRPAAFGSAWAELGFCFSILSSMLMAEFFISGFIIVLPGVTQSLRMPPGTQTWPVSVFSLVTGALLFPFGRVSDMHGGRPVFLAGMFWFFAWTLVAGFSDGHVLLIVSRAMQGLGPAAFLPSGVMLLGSVYRPGPRKNIVFSLYGSCAPLGFFLGIFVGGLMAEFLVWRWYFWIGSIMLFVISVVSVFSVPDERKKCAKAKRKEKQMVENVQMDWAGVMTTVPGLLLVIFAITQGAHAPQGFSTPYIYVTLVVGAALLAAAVYVEGWVAKQPLIPFDLFAPKFMTPMVIALFNTYGAFGIYQFYASFYIQEVIGASPLLAAVWFIPMAAGGLILAVVGGLVLHLLPGHLLLIISGMGSLLSTLMLALIPEWASYPHYWAFVFPAMCGCTIGVDIAYNVSSVFMTTSLPAHRQGLAGALINSLVFLGIGFYLGLADLIVETTKHGDGDGGDQFGFKSAFWLGVATSAAALIVAALFTRIGRAKSDLTVDERLELEAEARMLQHQASGVQIVSSDEGLSPDTAGSTR